MCLVWQSPANARTDICLLKLQIDIIFFGILYKSIRLALFYVSFLFWSAVSARRLMARYLRRSLMSLLLEQRSFS